jgi:hypothetical protein
MNGTFSLQWELQSFFRSRFSSKVMIIPVVLVVKSFVSDLGPMSSVSFKEVGKTVADIGLSAFSRSSSHNISIAL